MHFNTCVYVTLTVDFQVVEVDITMALITVTAVTVVSKNKNPVSL